MRVYGGSGGGGDADTLGGVTPSSVGLDLLDATSGQDARTTIGALRAPSGTPGTGDLTYFGGSTWDLTGADFRWTGSRLDLGAPTIGANDAGLLVVDGIVRFGTGLQSYGVGNGSTIGNARGTGAIDLQTNRNAATKVASGLYAAIGGGQNNTASASYATVSGGNGNSATSNDGCTVVGGTGNTASGGESIAGGDTCTASGSEAIALGKDCTASAGQAFASGQGALANHYGEFARASGIFAVQGDAQVSQVLWRNTTASATQTELFLEGGSQRFTLTDDSTYTFDLLIVARRTDANDESAGYRCVGVIDRNSGAATTALVGSVTTTVLGEDTAAWDVAVDADTTNGGLRVRVTGEAAKTIRWVAAGRIVKVTG